MARLRSGDVDVSRAEIRAGYLFPSVLTIPEMLHSIFNSLKEALESSEGWPPFESILRSLVTTVGSRMWRDRFIALCMADALTSERRLMRAFDGHKFDWRWEVLATVVVVSRRRRRRRRRRCRRRQSTEAVVLRFKRLAAQHAMEKEA